ncbi:RNAse (barnase) inhibitor barstar [Deinococcus metalli]|uniref:Nuclease inhibitor n=1 Tax=Deinococcus metalli TaxID=1141878 RepID=A0A7W8KDD3_9DEIO|nr:barstar family protein [Deinococcus metalli]MBB5374993.1 RNAse (barnase) inhibitor barstar [Deinococcus metalli]GHF32225.1 nuclease inhibitor [Deinococcus metalli]
MIQIFDEAPAGLQPAPHDPRVIAAGYQVTVREVDFGAVDDKDSVMLAFLAGLGLAQSFGRNWDALYDVLSDPGVWPPKLAILLCDYGHFRSRHARLSSDLDRVLLDAQAEAARQDRNLWLLIEEPDSDPNAW